ncbi:hypothetical protein SMALB_3535 [Streptomyces malaysiensis]|uniref:Uncharacterized protein n=1 Tax=Streptomyces malaysiensis TaxID=92644 RepID=A0A7X5X2P1_STRMQ|nr:hypothetical protein [Streptomyces malaysiensis]
MATGGFTGRVATVCRHVPPIGPLCAGDCLKIPVGISEAPAHHDRPDSRPPWGRRGNVSPREFQQTVERPMNRDKAPTFVRGRSPGTPLSEDSKGRYAAHTESPGGMSLGSSDDAWTGGSHESVAMQHSSPGRGHRPPHHRHSLQPVQSLRTKSGS